MKKSDTNHTRDKSRDRGGWKAQRNQDRKQKKIGRGSYVGKRVARAQGKKT